LSNDEAKEMSVPDWVDGGDKDGSDIMEMLILVEEKSKRLALF
jgi:hypothetical protein